MPREFHTHRQVSAAFHQELCHRQSAVEELRHGVKNWCLSPDPAFIYSSPRIDVRSTLQQQFRGFRVAVFSRDVQKRRSLQLEQPRACAAEVQLRKTPMHQGAVPIEVLLQKIEPPTKQIQNRRHVVLRNSARLDKNVHALAKLRRTSIRADHIIQRSPTILAAFAHRIRISSALQKPFNRLRLNSLARCENNREISVPFRVYIRPASQ